MAIIGRDFHMRSVLSTCHTESGLDMNWMCAVGALIILILAHLLTGSDNPDTIQVRLRVRVGFGVNVALG